MHTIERSAPSTTFALWQRLAARPLGKLLFSVASWVRVPYFGTILPTVVRMRPGEAEVRAPKWWGVHNHLGTFHAIAMCNLAEYAMGMLAEATVPATHRWIPRHMNVDYLAKAKTGLRAVAAVTPLPVFGPDAVDLPVPVLIYDSTGRVVVQAIITIKVSPRD
ncbi:MAG TPA: hotdog fold domain-containing protein [Actinophytocola sp.]|uniref:hotdog fold domain-containing protein n=1 Tax=Actinophytocola sp. TaxID=1872138 RepID=UPI002DB6A884|nr:hotdog fold domain-containing protein [Actinophytocola sp.]HEU5473744.1 hotdog fold domain-containing protein [Actinophytocola sp.]